MNVSLAGFALFLHITVAIAAFMIAGVLHVAFNVLPRVRTVAEMRPWTAVIHRLEPLLPILALVLLGLGAWLMRTETELVLKSRRVVPARLLDSDFTFEFPTWPEAARDLCQRRQLS